MKHYSLCTFLIVQPPIASQMSRGECMAVDPVCKMDVNEKEAQWKTEYQGKTYYFCAPGCKKAFEENPQKYL